jgi:hypothetical protein
MERYLYEVRPFRPVSFGGVSIRRACSMQLTKEEVMMFMGYGPVYRKFANTDMEPIKVTGENLNSLHQEKYVAPENNDIVKEVEPEQIVTPVVEEVPVAEPVIEVTQVSEPEEVAVEEEKVEEPTVAENSEESASEEVEADVEEPKEKTVAAPFVIKKQEYYGKHNNNKNHR